MHPVITAIIVLIVAGFILYLVNNYIPLKGIIKTLFNILIIVLLVLWLLKFFGVLSAII